MLCIHIIIRIAWLSILFLNKKSELVHIIQQPLTPPLLCDCRWRQLQSTKEGAGGSGEGVCGQVDVDMLVGRIREHVDINQIRVRREGKVVKTGGEVKRGRVNGRSYTYT